MSSTPLFSPVRSVMETMATKTMKQSPAPTKSAPLSKVPDESARRQTMLRAGQRPTIVGSGEYGTKFLGAG